MSYKTPFLIEQHIHGAYGVDFNTATVDEILFLADKLLGHGIGGFFPTLVTDSVENIKKQISVIRKAAEVCPRILGVHLEGIFINPEKKGIHNQEHFLELTAENYRLIEDDFIKIVTLAPELDKGLINYLKLKGIKIQAGHCVGNDFDGINGATHTFNAMSEISHRKPSTTLETLVNNDVYAEIIADGIHVSDDALNLFFRSKPKDKVILVSDALPITYSDIHETFFADSKIFYDGEKATSENGTIAGSTMLLDEIIKRISKLNLFDSQFILNPYLYHDLQYQGEIIWDEDWNILEVRN